MGIQLTDKENQARIRATLVSVILGSFILALKFAAYTISNSTALKSDAYESTVNVVSALFALGAIIFAGKPADADHPYGHGKIEHFSAVFEGGLISLASLLIIYEGVHAIIVGPHLKQIDYGIALNLIAGLFNGALGWYLIRSGRKLKSHAIEADGHHVLSDFITSLALLGGLAIVWVTKIAILDAVITLIVGIYLATVGFKLVKKSAEALLDIEDPETLNAIINSYNELNDKNIITFHGLRTFRSGRNTHVDVHVVVPEFKNIREAHDIVENYGLKILSKSNLDGEFHSHIDPCRKSFCKSCEVNPCSIRSKPFEKRAPLTINEAIKPDPEE